MPAKNLESSILAVNPQILSVEFEIEVNAENAKESWICMNLLVFLGYRLTRHMDNATKLGRELAAEMVTEQAAIGK